jgi:hypothetical protein
MTMAGDRITKLVYMNRTSIAKKNQNKKIVNWGQNPILRRHPKQNDS